MKGAPISTLGLAAVPLKRARGEGNARVGVHGIVK